MSQERYQREQKAEEYRQDEDEISLIDLALVLYRRRWWIVGVFLTCLLAGIVHWQLQSTGQRYLSSLDIGTFVQGEETNSIEPREELATRLRESTLPRIRHELASELEIARNELPEVSIRVPQEDQPGGYVFLNSQSGLEKEDLIQNLHQKLIDLTIEHHQELLNSQRDRFQTRLEEKKIELTGLKDDRILEYERSLLQQDVEKAQEELARLYAQQDFLSIKWDSQIQDAKNQVEGLKNKRESLEAKLEQTDEQRDFLQEQEKRALNMLDTMWQFEKDSLSKSSIDSSLTMSLLLKGSFASELQSQVREIQEKLKIDLPEKKFEIQADLKENMLEIQEAQQNISLLQAEKENALKNNEQDIKQAKRSIQKANSELEKFEADHERSLEKKQNEIQEIESLSREFRPTEASAVAIPSEILGRGGSMILSLAAVLGLMLGVFAAFFVEFAAKARQVAKNQQ